MAWSVFAKALHDTLGFTAILYSVAIILFVLFMAPAGMAMFTKQPKISV